VTGEPLQISARWDASWQGVMSQFGWAESIPELARVEFPSASGQDN
jgi:tRNA pseudouridine65 synthase